MAETITIPSPSVFLRATPDPPTPPSKPQDSTSERRRPLPKKKKKTTPVTHRAVDSAAVSKPKQSKSRNGCVTCKAKRLKCDETKPGCQQCKRRSVECGGYKKDFKWRPFEETNVATNIAKQRKASSPPVPVVSHSDQARETPATVDVQPCRNSEGTSDSPLEEVSSSFAQQIFVSPEREQIIDHAQQNTASSSATRAGSADSAIEPALPNSLATDEISPGSTGACVDNGAGEELLVNLDTDLTGQDYGEFDGGDVGFMPELSFPLPLFLDDDLDDDFEMDIENVSRLPTTTPDYDAWALRLASRPLSVDDISNKTPATCMSGPFTYLYEQPFFHEGSEEMLSMRFDKLTCGILSVKDGPNENPWRTLIWPMAKQSPALYHAVNAMTAFHSSRDVPALRLVGHEHKSASLQILATGINEGTMNHDTAIATTLTLAFAECWDQHISSGNDHIKGARVMMNIALDRHKARPLTGVALATLKFLCNAWVYMDVLARVTTVDVEEVDDYDKLYCLYSDPQNSIQNDPGFGIDFGMPIDATLDPLMGCASTLFPLIGRVANLVRRVCRSKSNSAPMISQAMELKLLLETWDPPSLIEPPEDPTSSAQHSIQTAEAYRQATLLYLHQALPEIPGDTSAELAKKVLVLLATVPLASRTVIVHIYPLMMAGCEATDLEERQWVQDRWAALSQRMRIGPIDKCLEVTREVWRRRDEYESQPQLARPLISTAGLRSSESMRPRVGSRPGSYDRTNEARECMSGWTSGRRPSRMGLDDLCQSEPSVPFRRPRASSNGGMDPMYTVRGKLHWIGVMCDWGWEVLLG